MSVLEIYTFPANRTFYLNTGSTKDCTHPSGQSRVPMVMKGEGVGGGDDDDDEDSKNHGESCSSSYSSDWVLITA